MQKNESQFDINHQLRNNDNDTLLSYSISYKESEAYHYLLKRGANIFAINDEGESIFHSIVYAGLPERFDVVLKYYPDAMKLINSQTNEGVTPLLLAAMLEKHPICEYLVKLGANVNKTDNTNNAPIHPACFLGQLDIVKLLVEHGADLKIKTLKGNFPLALAINGGHEDVAKYLLSLPNIWLSSSKLS